MVHAAWHAGRVARYFAERLVDPDVHLRASPMQPVGHSQKLDLIAQSLLADQQKPAAEQPLALPLRISRPNQAVVFGQFVMPTILLPALLEIARAKLCRGEVELHQRVAGHQARGLRAMHVHLLELAQHVECK